MAGDNEVLRGANGKGGDGAYAEALSSIQLIESLLGEEERKGLPKNPVRLPLGRILDLIPEKFRCGEADEKTRQRLVGLYVGDIFEKLAKGKVVVTVAELAFGIPADLVVPEAFAETGTNVVVPLSEVVAAIDPELLEQQTCQSYRRYNVAAMADPFSPPRIVEDNVVVQPISPAAEVVPTLSPVVEQPAHVEVVAAPPPARLEEPASISVTENADAPSESGEKEPEPSSTLFARRGHSWTKKTVSENEGDAEPEAEPEQIERLGGVNLNAALEEQLRTLPGVSQTMARNIVEYRLAHGPFKGIFSLCNVPGLGRKTFRHITGMPWSERHLHRNRKLSALLGLQPRDVGHLPTVAAALAQKLNFAGCIISDQDGLVLAGSGAGGEGESFAAIVPRLIFQLREGVKALQADEIKSVSICFGRRMFTLAVSGSIYLTCIHQTNRLTMGQLKLFNKVAEELAWLLSHRGYVGRPS